MAYGDLPTVQGLIAQFPISATTNPTTTQAGVIIDDVSSEVDVRLAAAGYAVPVAAPAYFLGWLGLLNAYGAAAAILKSMFPDAVGPGDTPAYAFWEARYQDGLKAIGDNAIDVPGAAASGTNVLPSTYLTRNPDTEEAIGDIAEPLFSMGKSF